MVVQSGYRGLISKQILLHNLLSASNSPKKIGVFVFFYQYCLKYATKSGINTEILNKIFK
ncbi:hypothetical protein GCM10028805_25150 [Spirosoma harenae]